MQSTSMSRGAYALQIFQGQGPLPMQKSSYNELYTNIFNKLSTFSFNRCYLVCQGWKAFCSVDILCESRVTKLIKQIFSIGLSYHVQNAQLNPDFFSSRQQFDEGIVKYDDCITSEVLSNLKKQTICSLGNFASTCHQQMIQNRHQLLDLFSTWLPSIEPGYDGILRVTFFGCKKFYFEIHCLFLKGSDNRHYAYLPFFFDPHGCDMNAITIRTTGEKSFGRNHHFQSLSIRFDMPPLVWSLEDISEDLSQIFNKHVDALAKNIYSNFKINI